jgi:hypothetical protein
MRWDPASSFLRTRSRQCARSGSVSGSPRAGPRWVGRKSATPRGDLLTRIDYEGLGRETYGIMRAELQQAMLEAVPAERLRLGAR